MASTKSVSADVLPNSDNKELDLYASEFAKLVSRHPPSPTESPSDWLARLPNEAFHYYHEGTSTFGREARQPIERRGRLYLIHTTLVFMWMSWGKKTARRRFKSKANVGTRRTASLIALEHYRRGGILADYNTYDWFFQPVNQWTGSLISAAVRKDRIADPDLKSALQEKTIVQCPVETISELRATQALPNRESLSLD